MFEGLPRDRIATPIAMATPYQMRAHAAASERTDRIRAKAKFDPGMMTRAELAVHRAACAAAAKIEEQKRLEEQIRRDRESLCAFIRKCQNDLAVQAVQLMSELGIRPRPKVPTVSEIQRLVAKHYGVTVADLISHSRAAHVNWPRHIAAYLSRRMTGLSLPEIARRFGGRDHTTILNSVVKIQWFMNGDPELTEQLAAFERTLASDGGG